MGDAPGRILPTATTLRAPVHSRPVHQTIIRSAHRTEPVSFPVRNRHTTLVSSVDHRPRTPQAKTNAVRHHLLSCLRETGQVLAVGREGRIVPSINSSSTRHTDQPICVPLIIDSLLNPIHTPDFKQQRHLRAFPEEGPMGRSSPAPKRSHPLGALIQILERR